MPNQWPKLTLQGPLGCRHRAFSLCYHGFSGKRAAKTSKQNSALLHKIFRILLRPNLFLFTKTDSYSSQKKKEDSCFTTIVFMLCLQWAKCDLHCSGNRTIYKLLHYSSGKPTEMTTHLWIWNALKPIQPLSRDPSVISTVKPLLP